MIKKIFSIIFVVAASLFLSGCSLSDYAPKSNKPAEKVPTNSSFLKSFDKGSTWEAKMRIDDKKDISGVDVLTMAVHPTDANIAYLGTNANGILMTVDGGENWKQVTFPQKVYGLVLDSQNPQIVYATAFNNKRGKIYKRVADDQEWKEIYTEPGEDTFVTALAIDKFNPKVLYAGTNQGVLIKTINGGDSWINLKKKADRPIVSITLDGRNSNLVYFGIFQQGIWRSRNGGEDIDDITQNITQSGNFNFNTSVYTAVADPWLGNTIYLGTEKGVLRSSNAGDKWEAVNVIESSKAFPIRAIAINPFNSKEILYASSKAIYKSVDSGVKWATFQLNTKRDVSVIRYNPVDANVAYIGMRAF